MHPVAAGARNPLLPLLVPIPQCGKDDAFEDQLWIPTMLSTMYIHQKLIRKSHRITTLTGAPTDSTALPALKQIQQHVLSRKSDLPVCISTSRDLAQPIGAGIHAASWTLPRLNLSGT